MKEQDEEIKKLKNEIKHIGNSLKKLLVEFEKNAKEYGELEKTGNSKGEHKDWYKGKEEAYSYCSIKLKRLYRWHSLNK